jgi:hypothetical protein
MFLLGEKEEEKFGEKTKEKKKKRSIIAIA